MALRVEERIVAGSEGGSLLVHHLVVRGSDRQVGRHLGEVARARYHLAPAQPPEPFRAGVQGEWLRRHAPALFERARGAAEAFGEGGLHAAGRLITRLGVPPSPSPGAAVFLSASCVHAEGPLLARRLDRPAAPEGAHPLPPARPYVLELHPEDGLPSLALVAFDLLGGVLDGVNGAGVAVVVAADLELAEAQPLEPDPAAVGLDELQLARLVLDTARDAAEARALLLGAKHAYAGFPALWLVADRQGDAFVLEIGPGRNRVHLSEAAGEPLVLANHPLHRYARDSRLPRREGAGGSYARYRALRAALAERGAPWTAEALAAAVERAGLSNGGACARSALWCGVYHLAERALEVRFASGGAGADGGQARAAWTPPLRFELQG
jgi:hypothetical protein